MPLYDANQVVADNQRPGEESLFAIICVSLSSKYFESKSLSIIEMHTLTNQSYTRGQLNQTEEAIVGAFHFDLFDPKRLSPSELMHLYLESCRPVLPASKFDLIKKTSCIILDLCMSTDSLPVSLSPQLASVASMITLPGIHAAVSCLTHCSGQLPSTWRLSSITRLAEVDVLSAVDSVAKHVLACRLN